MIRANRVAESLNPKELSIPLLLKNINAASQTGFPRDLIQSDYFTCNLKPVALVILLECSELVYVGHLLSGFDDNSESIKGHLHTYNKSTSEVIAVYESAGKFERARGDTGVEEVKENIRCDGIATMILRGYAAWVG